MSLSLLGLGHLSIALILLEFIRRTPYPIIHSKKSIPLTLKRRLDSL